VPLLAAQRQKGKRRPTKSGKSAAAPTKTRRVAKVAGGLKKAGARKPRSRLKAPPG
jgi:hypothetical protein